MALRIAGLRPEVIAAVKAAVGAAAAPISVEGLGVENEALTGLSTADAAGLVHEQLAAGAQTRAGERGLESILNGTRPKSRELLPCGPSPSVLELCSDLGQGAQQERAGVLRTAHHDVEPLRVEVCGRFRTANPAPGDVEYHAAGSDGGDEWSSGLEQCWSGFRVEVHVWTIMPKYAAPVSKSIAAESALAGRGRSGSSR